MSVSNGLESPLAVGAVAVALSVVGASEASANYTCQGVTITSGSTPISYADTVSTYGSACTITIGSSTTTYGTQGVCLQSIKEAVDCAVRSLEGSFGSAGETLASTLTVGNGSSMNTFAVDLTRDLSINLPNGATLSAYATTPTFKIPGSGAQAPSASCTSASMGGCLTIKGTNDPALTVITTATGQHEVEIDGWSHVLVSGMTFRMPMELMDQGTHALSGTTTLTHVSGSGTTTLVFPTVTMDIIPQTGTPQIENPTSFAALTPASASITFPSSPGTILADVSSGGACTSDATIALSISQTSGLASVASIVSPASGCASGYPNTTQPVPTSACVTIGGVSTCASVYVAYTATPMAQWISNLNSNYAHPTMTQFESDLKAYTIAHGTSNSSSQTSSTGSVIENLVGWGGVYFNGGIFVPVLPSQAPGSPNEWTLTLDTAISNGGTVPPYFTDSKNYVCSHVDDSTVVDIENNVTVTSIIGGTLTTYVSNGGSDVIFDHVDWVNTARAEIQGTPFTQMTNDNIIRDNLAYASQTITSGGSAYAVIPCYGSVNGGPQFSQPSGPATYGNTISNFSADSTADDSLAMYNDVGGYTLSSLFTTICGSTICPQSNVTASTFKNADKHPIRLFNNNAVTGIPDVSGSKTFDSGSCTSSMLGTTGSPVCVDASTLNNITMTTANCDTFALGGQCPIYFDFSGN